jgi:hypothetical protein
VKRNCSQPFAREEHVTAQVDDALRNIAVPQEWTDWMLAELDSEQAMDAAEYARELAAVTDRRRQIDLKLDRLLSAYLEGDVAPDEYRSNKERVLLEKQRVADVAKALTVNRGKRFEPVTRFVKTLQEDT